MSQSSPTRSSQKPQHHDSNSNNGGATTAANGLTGTTTSSPSKTGPGGGGGGMVASMSTSALETKLRQLRDQSNRHSAVLTQKLASSPAGQNLLHIGTALSTLPPDLHGLLTQLHPVLSAAERSEQSVQSSLRDLVDSATGIRLRHRRAVHAEACAASYGDLASAEARVERDARLRRWQQQQQQQQRHGTQRASSSSLGRSSARRSAEEAVLALLLSVDGRDGKDSAVGGGGDDDDDDDDDYPVQERSQSVIASAAATQEQHFDTGSVTDAIVDHVCSLERGAHIALGLLQDLQSATATANALTTTTTTVAAARGGGAAAAAEDGSAGNRGNTGAITKSLRTPLDEDTERAQFLMRLAPRIRRLESDTVSCLSQRMEWILDCLQEAKQQQQQRRSQIQPQEREQKSRGNGAGGGVAADEGVSNDVSLVEGDQPGNSPRDGGGARAALTLGELLLGIDTDAGDDRGQHHQQQHQQRQGEDAGSAVAEDVLLLLLGHCMRGLALLGRGSVVESVFASKAIMPVVRSQISMGRLDRGGARGECAGLPDLLRDITDTVAERYGPVLSLAEATFDVGSSEDGDGDGDRTSDNSDAMPVDLLTAGVWVPIATALMADAGIKMAIFSPGIASILQANYVALHRFLDKLARRLLTPPQQQQLAEGTEKAASTAAVPDSSCGGRYDYSSYYYRPTLSGERVRRAQDRIYAHGKTAEFSKKWNLPIYYQLRFGECCTRVNRAVERTRAEGWISDAFSGSEGAANDLRERAGFELGLFLELYDVLEALWRPDVVLRPLTNRFLRGSVQLVGRVVGFVSDGMEGRIKFGQQQQQQQQTPDASDGGGDGVSAVENGDGGADPSQTAPQPMFPMTRAPYCWGDSEDDVAAVAWELTVLDSAIRHDYVSTVFRAIAEMEEEQDDGHARDASSELRDLVTQVLQEACDGIQPVVDKAWNGHICQLLTQKCSAPLAAVKGVAATYRMTNRPAPTQASPFLHTVLRPLAQFATQYRTRTPESVGMRWKQQIVVTVADRYAAAVRELIATVERTEVALKNRKAATRRAGAAGNRMSDGEKVKLQLYLDYRAFVQATREVGVDPNTVLGLTKLGQLTSEGERLFQQQQQQQQQKQNGR